MYLDLPFVLVQVAGFPAVYPEVPEMASLIKIQLSSRYYLFDLHPYFVITAIFRNLQTVHNTCRCLCSPRTKRTLDTIRTALVKRLRISYFQWLDVVGVDVVGVDVVGVDVVGVLGPLSVAWTLHLEVGEVGRFISLRRYCRHRLRLDCSSCSQYLRLGLDVYGPVVQDGKEA